MALFPLIKPHLTQFVLFPELPPKQTEVDAQNLGILPSWIPRDGSVNVLEQVDGKLTGSPAGAKPKG